MSCAAFGEALVKATVGNKPGLHTRQQAQSLKDVLFALGPTQPDGISLDPALRLPLATALADYTPDVHEMLAGLDSTYLEHAGRAAPPWEAEGTYRLSVYDTFLRDALLAVSEDPHAYAVLRTADSRHVPRALAAVPRDAKGSAMALPPRKGARVLGVFDGLASMVTDGMGEDDAKAWRATVAQEVAGGLATSGAGTVDTGADLSARWLADFRKVPEEGRFGRLSEQGVDLTRIWLTSRNAGQAAEDLLDEVADSAQSGRLSVDLP
ncbi:hypothetical protein [Streptomyces roseicoloratus]|uniref:hypothetical protein n=1 Tax=Streptomyces roseicoloratus TaxID=2508722 RepID=UPI001009FB22|nr:hypothetical protein [Streptomyces roseicoloratus]